ncbi:MAG: energy-coupling factor transporter transmembrane component T [Anaerolineales bacterium]|nr:energy-coupling factor transporter transmembrane protein EcfT [Anaerolineales bacterium]MCS7248777.1 energy-coupling factor transporter transmembrane protein EcfT [Anaerolineales bacterium]MDW8162590.1 energy-coupling factor transporter transmembrane component T [Anaerolineales bacterium]MDW8446026.1 energy-coupling factor transporter transmembrane component T [Anaerolineales bacterium]
MSEQLLAYVEKESPFHRADALSKLLWVILVVLATFQFQTTLSRAMMFLALLFTALVVARVPWRSFWRVSPLIFGVAVLLGAFHYAVTPRFTPLFSMGSYVIFREPLEAGGAYFFRLAIMVLASFLLIWTTDTYQLMVGLAYLGLPYRYAFAIFMALRYIPLIQREVEAVQAAHAIRGRAVQSPLKHRFRLWQRYLFTVIVNGLRKAENTAIAIESRGFGAYPQRTYWKEFRWTRSGILLVLIFVFFSLALIVWERFLF